MTLRVVSTRVFSRGLAFTSSAASPASAAKARRPAPIATSKFQSEIWDTIAPQTNTAPVPIGKVNVLRTSPGRDHEHRDDADKRAPVVVLGGTAQVLASLRNQSRDMAATGRDVYAYEMRGQGATSLVVNDSVSFKTHVDDFALMFETLGFQGPVDLCGFSFGGRVAMAIAANHPRMVRRVVLSGVAEENARRDLLSSWKTMAEEGDLVRMVRSAVTNTHSKDFLRENASQIEKWIAQTAKANNAEGIVSLTDNLLRQPDQGWSARELASRVRCPVLMLTGEHDKLAPPSSVQAFARDNAWSSATIPRSGHGVALENREDWLAQVMRFLDDNSLDSFPALPKVPALGPNMPLVL